MAASGRVKAWKDIFQRNTVLPVPFDREKSQSQISSPLCIQLKTIEGLISKVIDAFQEARSFLCLFRHEL